MPKIGTGYVSVDADLSPFWRTIEREMATGGEKAGRSFSKGFGDGIDDRSISRSLDRVERSTRRTTKGFEGLVSSFGGGNDGIRKAARSLDRFGGSSGGATATIGGLRIAVAALIPVLVGFGGASVAAVSSLGPLIGLLAAGGNAAGAAAQGLGVFSLATMGVSDALKEQADKHLKTASAAVSDASQQRSAARSIQTAQDGVRDAVGRLIEAQRDATRTQKDLSAARTEARRALTDMASGLQEAIVTEQRAILGLRDAKAELAKTIAGASPEDIAAAQGAVTDAALDQTQAVLNLSKAQDAYNTSLTDPSMSPQDRAQALVDLARAQEAVAASQRSNAASQEALAKLQSGATDEEKAKAVLDVADAEQQVTQSRRDRVRQEKALADAQKAGVEGSKQVVDAQEAIQQADKRVADAQRDVTRATEAVTDAQQDAADAMNKSGVAATNLNQKFDDLPPAAKAFTRELLSMKPQLDSLRQTAAQGFFPGATEGLRAATGSFSEVKGVIGETSVVLGEAARKSGELVGSPAFGKDIAIIGHNNAKVIDTLGEALRHVISAIRHVMVAAGPLTQWLADTINKWALHAAAAAKSGRETGKLAAFFKRTRDITERLGSIIGHLTSGLIGVGKAGTTSGNDIWKSIDRAARRFDKWANSKKGQQQLKDFFKDSKELAAALTPVIADISKAVAFLTLKFLPLTAILEALGPYADEATVAFVAYKVAVFGVAAASRAASVASRAWAAGLWLLNAALWANPITIVAGAIVALVAGFIYAYTHSEKFREIVDGALRAVGDAFKWLWDKAKDVFGWLKDHWPLLLSILTGPFGLAVGMIIKHWDDIKQAVSDGIKAVLNAIKSAANWFINAGKDIVGWIVGGIKSVATALADAAGWLKNRIVDGIHAAIDGFKAAGSWILNRVVDGFKAVTDLLGTVGGWVKNRISEFIHNEAEGLKVIGSWILNRLVDGFKTVTDVLGSVGGWLKNRIGDAIHSVGGGLKGVGGSIMDFIVDGMKGGINKLIDFINVVLDIVEEIPGIGDIKPIKHLKTGDGKVQHRAMGGKVTAPMAIVGEEKGHPEYVIPTNPAYRGRAIGLTGQLMKDLGLPGFATGGILGKVAGAVTGLVGNLPGIGGLPDWLKGTGKWVLEHIGKWIKDTIASIIPGSGGGKGGGGGSVPSGGVSGSIRGAMALARDMGLAITSTTGGNHVPGSWHYKGRAADIAGSPQQMAAFFNAALARYGSHLLELFYDPLGAIKNGARIPAIGGHSDHVHIALAKGGILPFAGSFADGGIVGGSYGSPAMAAVHGGEAIVPDGGALISALHEHSNELRLLRRTPHMGVIDALVDITSERTGDRAVQRGQTAGRGVTALLGG